MWTQYLQVMNKYRTFTHSRPLNCIYILNAKRQSGPGTYSEGGTKQRDKMGMFKYGGFTDASRVLFNFKRSLLTILFTLRK
jgi:hypothetical protein